MAAITETKPKNRRKKWRVRQTWDDKVFDIVVMTILIFLMLVVLYPLVFVVSSSFSDARAVMTGRVLLWPVEPTLEGYRAVLRNRQIMMGFRNSLIYTSVGVVLNLIMGMLAAFPLSRKDLFGRRFLNLVFIFTMFFSGGLVPHFLLVGDTLGLMDNPLALILPGMMSVWYVILIRTYIQSSIPEELIESAELDGCKTFKIMRLIIIPLSKPIMAVIALFCAVAIWNRYFDGLIFIRSERFFPLQVVLRNILILSNIDPEMMSDIRGAVNRQAMQHLIKYAVIVVSSAPLLLAYPFVQRHFVKGIMLGSVKG
ncbi:MAG: carbohydrate ABC transporter permease [Defluviitaleaceae bacterium]|nr:carbohydrate ABC transporter permease [Defluviitaleaceae bacterium]